MSRCGCVCIYRYLREAKDSETTRKTKITVGLYEHSYLRLPRIRTNGQSAIITYSDMEYTMKVRLYPNREQEELIQKTFGCCRYVYNHFLALRKETYETSGQTLNFFACSNKLTELKKDLPWLSEVDSQALQQTLRNLDRAYQNFFRRVKQGGVPGYPQFKRKSDNRKSYRTTKATIQNGGIKLPKLGCVKCRGDYPVDGRIISVTVSQEPSGRYYCALCYTDANIPIFPETGKAVGVDLGIKDLAITSDGDKYPNGKYLAKSEKRLKRLQRSLSRKQKGSANRNKARLKVARLHERISNQRRDGIQKATTDLIRQYDTICIEDLNVSGMEKNHHLAKAVADASMSEVRRELDYKAFWNGRTISVIDRFYPSSQLCSSCGYQNPKTKDLSVRSWVCPQCGAEHDRDVNAAKNILQEGLRILK